MPATRSRAPGRGRRRPRRHGAASRGMTDSLATAEAAALRYVSDGTPGIHRVRAGRGFRYVAADGSPVRDFATRRRIRALAIPPAWTEVWICPSPDGHIQAVGRDAKGRKQYRYHARWREVRDATKYERLVAFARALPAIRRRVAEDLGRPGLPREKVLAAVVRLLETTLIRVGNDEYARRERLVRPDDAAQPARRRSRGRASASSSAARAGSGTSSTSRSPARPDRPSSARSCRATSCSSTWTRTGSATPSARRTSTRICARSRARSSRPRTSARGPERCWRRARCGTACSSPSRRRSGTSCGRSRPWRSAWATRRPSAGSATSTPRWSTAYFGEDAAPGRRAGRRRRPHRAWSPTRRRFVALLRARPRVGTDARPGRRRRAMPRGRAAPVRG